MKAQNPVWWEPLQNCQGTGLMFPVDAKAVWIPFSDWQESKIS